MTDFWMHFEQYGAIPAKVKLLRLYFYKNDA